MTQTTLYPSTQRLASRWRDQWALITGSSFGIGEEFARVLAAAGVHLVLVARSAAKLNELAATLRRSNVRVEVLAVDLTEPGAVQHIAEELRTRGIAVQLLVNNAGMATLGMLAESSAEDLRATLLLNNVALAELTHALLPGMLARGKGDVLHLGSTAGYQPVPYFAAYAASKAFVLSFSEALWAECRGTGVNVSIVSPGPVNTPFLGKLGASAVGLPLFRRPLGVERVVHAGLDALRHRRCSVVVGRTNALLAWSGRWLPRSWSALISGLMFRPRRAARLATVATLALMAGWVAAQANAAHAEANAEVQVDVGTFRKPSGRLGCQLFASGEGFPDKGWVDETELQVTSAHAQCTFRDVKPGTYAVAVLHDENRNRKVDKNLFGAPTEGYGVSNNKTYALRAPKWQESKFELSAGETKRLKVKLRY